MKKDINKIVSALKTRQTALGKERDLLRDLIMEAECLKDDCEEAYDDIDRAIDTLSKLV